MTYNPLESFFNLGNKVTGGDPVRKAQFDLYLYWVLAFAFFSLMLRYFYMFFTGGYHLQYLMWGLVMVAITYFNYFTLSTFYHTYYSLKGISSSLKNTGPDDNVELGNESIDEMMEGFKKDGSN